MTLLIAFAVLAILGTLITTFQALLTAQFRRRPAAEGGRRYTGIVSILKPVCGLDDELEENLVSFTALRGIDYEVIISIEDADDPAIEVVERVRREHPAAPFRVVMGGGSLDGRRVVNRKVERLIAAAAHARGEIFFISDSNVRIGPDDAANTIAQLNDPRIGCVSNLFTGSGASTLGATIESLHLLSFVVPGNVIAAFAGVPCVVGKSMALTREAHDAIGGFAAFRTVLAEDQAIALAVRNAGFEFALSPIVVRNVVVKRTIHRAVDRQIRWNKIRYSFSRSMYAAELLINPLPFAIAAASVFPWLLAIVLASRIAQVALLARATDAPLRARDLAAVPLLDVVMFYAQFVPCFSNEITWRGYRARIGRGTELIEVAA